MTERIEIDSTRCRYVENRRRKAGARLLARGVRHPTIDSHCSRARRKILENQQGWSCKDHYAAHPIGAMPRKSVELRAERVGVDDDHDIVSSVRVSMEKVVREFANPRTVDATLESITAAAASLIDGVDSVDVLLIDEVGDYRSAASTSPLSSDMSHLQHRLGYGPCIDAAVGETLVLSHDLGNDQRWPEYSAAAVAAGARSVMSLQLYTHQGRPSCRAALNMFSRSADAFEPDSQAAAIMLATHGALALIAHDREAQFRSALASRDAIGQAKGMLMERFTIDAVRAFELMVKLSQDTNTKLVNVAAQIVSAGPERSPK